MSDVISAWVDEDEMRRLAESLMSRPYGHEFNRLEVDFGSQFEGFANGAPVTPASPPNPAPAASPAIESNNSAAVSGNESSVASGLSEEDDNGVTPSGQVPSVVRSAVQFLKKAQSEGRAAGGVIREAKEAPSLPSPPPSQSTEVSYSEPSKPEPRPIYSPFRRVSEVEVESAEPAEQEPEEEPEPEQKATEEVEAPSKAVPQPPSLLESPPKPSGDDPILTRVMQFGKWLKGPVGVRNFFVSNIEGKILIDEVANPKLIQVARSLAGASGGSDGEIGSLHVRIGEDSILEVVPTPSQFGTLILGLVVEHSLPANVIGEVRSGLEEVANARLIKTSSQTG